MEKLFRERTDQDALKIADNFRLVSLVRELIRGFATSAVPRLDGAALTTEFELGPSLRLTNPVVVPAAVGLLVPAVNAARTAAQRMRSPNNLKPLVLATHHFLDSHDGALPARYTVDKNGQPLPSWRVLPSPYLEQTALYEQIRLDEPWDSEHNRQFHSKAPAIFRRPGSSDPGCFYSCVADGSSALQPAKAPGSQLGIRLPAVTDGASNTLLFVERNKPACRMDPNADLTLEEFLENAADPRYFSGGSNVGMCDGSVRFVSETVDPDVLKAMVTRNGGETDL